MSEGGEKTELPTPKKERDARQKGQVARSQEVVTTVSMFGAIAAISLMGETIWSRLTALIDQIAAIENQYMQLTRVRPGITSCGQVKYGYAENVDQMLQRMKFDLIYMKNRSLALDIKIMFYTVIIVFKAQGK